MQTIRKKYKDPPNHLECLVQREKQKSQMAIDKLSATFFAITYYHDLDCQPKTSRHSHILIFFII